MTDDRDESVQDEAERDEAERDEAERNEAERDEAVQQVLDRHPRPRFAPQEQREVRRKPGEPSEEACPDLPECDPTPITDTGSNGDEGRYDDTYIGNFHKGLEHDDFGQVVPAEYEKLKKILDQEKDFDDIPLFLGRKMVNPQAGLATDVEGPKPKSLDILAAPRLDSAEEAAEAVELYWMALLRDVHFSDFDTDTAVAAAAAEIDGLTDFTGPRQVGVVTPQSVFRGCSAGDLVGPFVSQFLLWDVRYGSLRVSQKQVPAVADKEYLTAFDGWLAIQNGALAGEEDLGATRRNIINMRDLGRYVHVDALYQAYLNACLILLDYGAAFDPGNPYVEPHLDEPTQIGFGTFGGPHVLSLVTEVATRALKAMWWQKWFVQRRLRPEAYGGLIEVKVNGVGGTTRDYPIHPQVLNSQALSRTQTKWGSALLPMMYPEGSPTHPAYGAGHATVAGACVTILKAFFDDLAPLPEAMVAKVANADGSGLDDYTGPDAGDLTVGGELNKLAANISIARNMAGVHWRSDYTQSVRLGEKVALSILRKQRHDYNEEDWSFSLCTFDGVRVTVSKQGVRDQDGHPVDLD